VNLSITTNGYGVDVLQTKSNEILGYKNISLTALLLLLLRYFDVRGRIVGTA
jgi:hypothetical protein